MNDQWINFRPRSNLHIPPIGRYVLVLIKGDEKTGISSAVAMGYLKRGTLCPEDRFKLLSRYKTWPYFVVPGFGRPFTVTHWCDCLGDKFQPPGWAKQRKVK